MQSYRPYKKPTPKPRHNHRLGRIIALVALIIFAGYGYYCLHRELPPLQPRSAYYSIAGGSGTSKLSWPSLGQSAVAVAGTDIVETHGDQNSLPIASNTKVLTALVILQHKPLAADQQGPTITLTDADVAIYDSYVAVQGSVAPVSSGEQITERQALEAMMLPSANNMADSLAIWAFGSLPAYFTAANQYLMTHKLHDTHIGVDASGFSPANTSTAHDLVLLGNQLMQQPVLRSIVSQPNATDIPGIATAKNVNFLLGTHNIIGIKTGNTDQAGGVYLSASTAEVDGQPQTVITALVGAPTLYDSLKRSIPLIDSAQTNFTTTQLVAKGAVIGVYRQPWGGTVAAVAQTKLAVTAWGTNKLSATASLQPITVTARVGADVGSINTKSSGFGAKQATPIVLSAAPTQPSLWWRLGHPTN